MADKYTFDPLEMAQHNHKMKQEGVNEGIKHSQPSPITQVFMDKVNSELSTIKIDIAVVKNSMKKVDKFIDSADIRYANKNIEKRVFDVEESVNDIKLKITKWAGITIGGVAVIQVVFAIINFITK